MTMNFWRCAAFALLSLAVSLSQAAEKTYSRNEVTSIIREGRKVVAPNGVEELLKISVGGTEQWISVRGNDRNNPILLMIHGGPASPEMPSSWFFENGWEDYFTVVQWDQRGAGKTFNANDPRPIESTLSIQRIAADGVEVIDYLRSRYHKNKVFILGHSWGSVVGLTIAHEHPELLYAYVGTGQVISGVENERVGYADTLKNAEATGNTAAVAELRSLAPYPAADGSVTLDKILTERKWSVELGGLAHGRQSFAPYANLAELSPEYDAGDIEAIDKGSQFSLGRLLPELNHFDFTHVTELGCPVVLIEGRHDTTTPSEIAAAWFAKVHAPAKKLIWLQNSAHMTMFEEPGRFLVHLVEDVRPFAGNAGQ